jgi:hypothetical protein
MPESRPTKNNISTNLMRPIELKEHKRKGKGGYNLWLWAFVKSLRMTPNLGLKFCG